MWQMVSRGNQAQDALANRVSQISRQVAALSPSPSSGMHPFKLYHIPAPFVQWAGGFALPTDWRMFIVRAGRVMNVDALKTDNQNSNPDSDNFPHIPEDVGNAIICPDNVPKFWFWLELNGTTPTVRWGDEPTVTDYTDVLNPTQNWSTSNPWTSFPEPDATHIPIGYVDTQTYRIGSILAPNSVLIPFSGPNFAVVRQLLRGDVESTGGTGVSYYRLKEVYGEYVVGRSWDGTTEGAEDVYIAKQPKLRSSIDQEIKFAGTYSYEYVPASTIGLTDSAFSAVDDDSKNCVRKSTFQTDGSIELELVMPIWIPDDTVAAVSGPVPEVFHDAGTQATHLMMEDNRHWAQVIASVQALPQGGITNQVLAKASVANYDAVWADATVVFPAGTALAQSAYTLAATGTNVGTNAYNLATTVESWFGTVHSVPAGGTTGQVLKKNSGTDFDSSWQPLLSQGTVSTTTGTISLDFSGSQMQSVSLTGDPFFNTTNRVAGAFLSCRVLPNGASRVATFHGDWEWLGTAYSTGTVASTKLAVLSLSCYGTTEADVISVLGLKP